MRKKILIGLGVVVLVIGIGAGGIYGKRYFEERSRHSSNSEEIEFVNKIKGAIMDHLKNTGGYSVDDKVYTFKKCNDSECSKKHKVSVSLYGVHEENGKLRQEIRISNLMMEDIVNPYNNKECFSVTATGEGAVDPFITVYRDSDGDFYYYVDLSGKNTLCNIYDKNALISNFPSELVQALRKKKVKLPRFVK